jgi:hypothetical protein
MRLIAVMIDIDDSANSLNSKAAKGLTERRPQLAAAKTRR